jgi:hypothetical protein
MPFPVVIDHAHIVEHVGAGAAQEFLEDLVRAHYRGPRDLLGNARRKLWGIFQRLGTLQVRLQFGRGAAASRDHPFHLLLPALPSPFARLGWLACLKLM